MPQVLDFDTMGSMGILMRVGFTQDQASAIVGTVRDAQRELVTKADLDLAFSELKADLDLAFSELKADLNQAFSELKVDFGQAFSGLKIDSDSAINELKADLGFTASEPKADMDAMKLELQEDLKKLDGNMDRYFTKFYWHFWISTGTTIITITSVLGMMIVFSS